MQDGGVTSTALRNGPMDLRLGPMSSLQVKDYEVGEVCPVLILAPKDQELVALV